MPGVGQALIRGIVVVRLLERESQLALLAEYAAEARLGDGRLVLIAGEAGVGKSALVEQAERDLPEAAWYWGACDGLFTPRPLGPLYDSPVRARGRRPTSTPTCATPRASSGQPRRPWTSGSRSRSCC
jgi:hypothetical protein